MPSWLLPAVKLILPHVGNIIAAAKPVFTKRKVTDQATVQQQITELQAAATENAALIKELAVELQTTLNALQLAAAATQERVRRLYAISVIAILVSLAALLVAVIAITSP